MPDRINIGGRWYVAEDSITAKPTEFEPFLPVRRLCTEYAVDPHRAYRDIKQGRLDARLPEGSTKGWRARRSEFERWLEEDLLRRA